MINLISFVGARGLSRDTFAPESMGNFSQCGVLEPPIHTPSLGRAWHGLKFHPVPRPARPTQRLNAFPRLTATESTDVRLGYHLRPPLTAIRGGFRVDQALTGTVSQSKQSPNSRWGKHLTSQWSTCFARLIEPENPRSPTTGFILMEVTA